MAEINTDEVMRHLGGARSAEEVARALDDDITAFATGSQRRWTVTLRASGEPVGRCGLFRVRTPSAPEALRGEPEVGWTFARTHWGHGYAAEAARAVIGLAFAGQDCDAIFAQTSDANLGSTALMQRLGMSRAPGLDYVDPDYEPEENPTRVYCLTRANWETTP